MNTNKRDAIKALSAKRDDCRRRSNTTKRFVNELEVARSRLVVRRDELDRFDLVGIEAIDAEIEAVTVQMNNLKQEVRDCAAEEARLEQTMIRLKIDGFLPRLVRA